MLFVNTPIYFFVNSFSEAICNSVFKMTMTFIPGIRHTETNARENMVLCAHVFAMRIATMQSREYINTLVHT